MGRKDVLKTKSLALIILRPNPYRVKEPIETTPLILGLEHPIAPPKLKLIQGLKNIVERQR